jgi:sarcosine oxidase subunit beta
MAVAQASTAAGQRPDSAGVVIVGGGVIGTSAAFHLAEAGVDVVLIERAQLGSGSTCRAAGGVRAQFSDALNIQIAQRSLAAFRAFGRRPGWEIDLQQVGYLFVLTEESDVEVFERNVALQNEYGVPSRILTAAEVRALCPLLEGDDILAGAFSPDDGHATPEAVVQGYAFAARSHGARIRTSCELLEITTRGGEITEVVTSSGSIRTGFSGHGFLQAPAVGEILRDMVLQRPAFVDVSPLSAERFNAAALRPEFNIV